MEIHCGFYISLSWFSSYSQTICLLFLYFFFCDCHQLKFPGCKQQQVAAELKEKGSQNHREGLGTWLREVRDQAAPGFWELGIPDSLIRMHMLNFQLLLFSIIAL